MLQLLLLLLSSKLVFKQIFKEIICSQKTPRCSSTKFMLAYVASQNTDKVKQSSQMLSQMSIHLWHGEGIC